MSGPLKMDKTFMNETDSTPLHDICKRKRKMNKKKKLGTFSVDIRKTAVYESSGHIFGCYFCCCCCCPIVVILFRFYACVRAYVRVCLK